MKCILLAGGMGERLWPLSRTLMPKALLKLYKGKSLLQNAYETALALTKDKNIVLVTNIMHTQEAKMQLREYSKNPIIISEPMTKNTAGAVCAGLTYLKSNRDEAVVILPVDFYIEDKELFINTINEAVKIAKSSSIAAVGVKPSYSETGFGYIKISAASKNGKKILQFIEKPTEEAAAEFINQKEYYWNCGIYAGKISVFENAFSKFAPDIYNSFSKEMFDNNLKIKYEYYENIPNISIDYAIMEKADNLVMAELKSGWNDMGSWHAIYKNSEKNSKGNVIYGNVLTDGVKDSLIYSSKELVCASGVKDIVVVETEDALLVCDKNKSQEINKIVSALKKEHSETLQVHKTVFRPWGYYTCLNKGEGWLTKVISVSPSHKLSLQSHNYRSEHWVVLSGTATVILEGETKELSKGQSIDIPVKAKHSLQNLTNEGLKILEVQKGDYISEDDIIRYEDIYGRVS